jgi:hypothetical protein
MGCAHLPLSSDPALREQFHSMKPGRSLEMLVHTLERALGKNPAAKIESPGYLEDIHTGERREHDVLMRASEGIHEVVVAIECRDRSRPFGVPDLEAFRQKCLDTRVSKAVVVSSSGFQETAREKARALGVACIDLTQAESFDWLALSVLPVFSQRLLHIELEMHVDTEGLEAINNDQVSLRSAGEEVTLDQVRERIRKYVIANAHAINEAGNYKMPFSLNSNGLDVVVKETGETFPVRQFNGAAYFSVERHESQFELIRYGDSKDTASSVEFAVAPVTLGELKGKIVIAMGSDGGEVLFLKDRPQ